MLRKNMSLKESKELRVATVCWEGVHGNADVESGTRIEALGTIGSRIAERKDWGPDAVVLPGGFLRADPDCISHIAIPRRNLPTWRDMPGYFPPAEAARRFFEAVGRAGKGTLLVMGVDTPAFTFRRHRIGGQQLVMAFNSAGLAGFARKIFLVPEDYDGTAHEPFLVHESDFSDPRRYVRLRGRTTTVLCVCYDIFGVADAARNLPEKALRTRLFLAADGTIGEGKSQRDSLRRAFDAFRQQIAQQRPAAALTVIHQFQGAGTDIFYQRHGIAAASAALNGGFAAGAAHVMKLPNDPDNLCLAAGHVPAAHLEAGSHRNRHMLLPRDSFGSNDTNQNSATLHGLARLFISPDR